MILLHGWPYDIHNYVDVAPLLAAQGYRVIVPYLRGHGATRFLSDDGSQIVYQTAYSGFDVTAYDISDEILEKAKSRQASHICQSEGFGQQAYRRRAGARRSGPPRAC